MSSVSAGQPSVDIGQSHDENQVSSTSSSCLRLVPPHFAHADGASTATVSPPHSQYHTGILCPHHSWREMHQSRMFVIQWPYVLVQRGGKNLTCFLRTTWSAGSASGFIFTNHCRERYGSITVSQR